MYSCLKVTQVRHINLDNLLIFSSEKEEQSNFIPRDVYDIWRKEERMKKIKYDLCPSCIEAGQSGELSRPHILHLQAACNQPEICRL